MRKTFYLLLLAGVVAGVSLGILFATGSKNSASTEQIQSATPAPPIKSEKIVDYPQQISIPKLSISAEIESVGVDSEGNMDIPSDFNNTAWYNMGPKPGEPGSAVIDGHVDTPRGEPAVFANISDLSSGDIIEVIDKKGEKYKFSVIKVVDYNLSRMPLEQIFSKNTPSMLNLITCAGVFDRTKKMYTMRTVVYSELVK